MKVLEHAYLPPQSAVDGRRSTAHFTELQNLFLVVSGEKVANHKWK